MSKRISIGPFTRINGLWHLKVEVENKRISDAWSIGTNFRGLEIILMGRDPRDAPYLTQRICGICSSTHALTSSFALEKAFKLKITSNGSLIKNLIFACDLLQSHLRQFYFLAVPDYVNLPRVNPLGPTLTFLDRLPERKKKRLLDNYERSVEITQRLHEMLVIFGGKAPHNHGILAGGATVPPDADKIRMFSSMLSRTESFVEEGLLPDLEALSSAYPEYYEWGKSYDNLLSFGMFPDPHKPGELLYSSGIIRKGTKEPFKKKKVNEQARYAFYQDKEPLKPQEGKSTPSFQRGEPYSWIKAPRYGEEVFETGPLARQVLRDKYKGGGGAMDRIYARGQECLEVVKDMARWVDDLEPGAPVFRPYEVPALAEGEGFLDAMRGALLHSVKIRNHRIEHYQIITPTAWNCSPRDNKGKRGPLEEALVGTPLEDLENPVEIGRVARSFDVCGSCAVHMVDLKGMELKPGRRLT
ncbi:MAG: hyaluronate lyase [Candidatus Syntrophonatronum acetioxidans]|uniref:Hyaluronate lyase n=1 Tax=Candidatus Syntrophonatronum acetioxidans TaxID=1795816 RepID=A0A424YFM8_9FIRM|nr:MAG: hyaluronate lyase [Candidatus Syntrophonatronum acetioxidans]